MHTITALISHITHHKMQISYIVTKHSAKKQTKKVHIITALISHITNHKMQILYMRTL